MNTFRNLRNLYKKKKDLWKRQQLLYLLPLNDCSSDEEEDGITVMLSNQIDGKGGRSVLPKIELETYDWQIWKHWIFASQSYRHWLRVGLFRMNNHQGKHKLPRDDMHLNVCVCILCAGLSLYIYLNLDTVFSVIFAKSEFKTWNNDTHTHIEQDILAFGHAYV